MWFVSICLFAAFVEFEEEESLTKALTLNGQLSMNNTEVTIHKQGTESKPRVRAHHTLTICTIH